MKFENNLPPHWAERLIESIAAPHLREEILGDLYELFQKRSARLGHILAQWLYIFDIILLIHPRLWRRNAKTARPPHYSTDFSKPNPIAMLRNYMKVALRKLNRHKSYTLINTVSLSLGIACAILIFALIKYHLSFEDFHADKERIYRIYSELHGEKISYNTGVPNPMGQAFRTEHNVAQKVARIAYLPNRVVSLNPQNKFEEDIAFADADFFDIFNFPLIEGDSRSALRDPNTALVTEQTARKYFGNTGAVGQCVLMTR